MSTLLEHHIVELLRSGQARTQAELCRLTGQNGSTISELLSRLKKRGWVAAVGTKSGSGRGRPTTVLRLNPGGYLAGIDLDGAHAIVGILDFEGKVVASRLLGFDARRTGLNDVLVECANVVRILARQHRIGRARIRGMGIGINGRVTSGGILEFSTVLPWRNQPVAEMAKRLFAMPVFVSDRQQSAVAEQRYGAGVDSRCMLHFSAADGVSARPVISGQLYTGFGGAAGQIGHVVVEPDGPLCGCGQHGCLEAIISGPAVCRQILLDADAGSCVPHSLVEFARRHAAVAMTDELVRLAVARDGYSERWLSRILKLSSQGLASAVACFSPDRIVVDGYLFRDRLALIDRLATETAARLGTDVVFLPPMVSSQLGDRARLMALVTLVSDGLARDGALVG